MMDNAFALKQNSVCVGFRGRMIKNQFCITFYVIPVFGYNNADSEIACLEKYIVQNDIYTL